MKHYTKTLTKLMFLWVKGRYHKVDKQGHTCAIIIKLLSNEIDVLIIRAEAETMVNRFKRNPNMTEAVLENMKKVNKSMQILGRENCSKHKWHTGCPQMHSMHIVRVTKQETKKGNWSEVISKEIMVKKCD